MQKLNIDFNTQKLKMLQMQEQKILKNRKGLRVIMENTYLNKKFRFMKFQVSLVMLVMFQLNIIGNPLIQDYIEKHSFLFENDNIQLTLSINKLSFEKQDSLIIDLEIVNKTKDTVLVFPNFEITYFKNKENRGLFIEHGGRFSPGLEGLEEMILIFPYSNFTLKTGLNTEFLINNGFSGFFPVFYSFAYVPSINSIYGNEHLSSLMHIKKSEREIEISNLLIFASLNIEIFEVFYCKLI